ncbi:MAG: helix-turn-helix domain-containing protein [Flavobacteriales bacterium]|nr:helix-turn-helix domain-containing protein [Flavobacteriales bacterium]
MKPIFFQNPKTKEKSIHVQVDRSAYFFDHLHYHPEVQITGLVSGEGTLIVGDRIKRFGPGDVFMLGANLPHVVRSDEAYYEPGSRLISHGTSVYFSTMELGDVFMGLPEMASVSRLVEDASRGIIFKGKARDKCHSMIQEMSRITGVNRLIMLLEILKVLSETDEYEFLSSVAIGKQGKETDNKRMKDTLAYMFNHYQEDIKLEDVAAVANMSTTAFCRYFKQRTRKTFSSFLNEIRIANACKMLTSSSMSISQICYQSGFNNVANFNRQFKRINNLTPSEYLKKFRRPEM